jgi:hypothetical protein
LRDEVRYLLKDGSKDFDELYGEKKKKKPGSVKMIQANPGDRLFSFVRGVLKKRVRKGGFPAAAVALSIYPVSTSVPTVHDREKWHRMVDGAQKSYVLYQRGFAPLVVMLRIWTFKNGFGSFTRVHANISSGSYHRWIDIQELIDALEKLAMERLAQKSRDANADLER